MEVTIASDVTTKQPVLLQVLPALETGGVERGTVEIAKAAAQAGFRSLVASSGGRMERQLANAGAEHILLPLKSKNPLQIKSNAKLLVHAIEDYGVDIVHARSRAPAWSAYRATQKTGAHFVTTFHGYYSTKGPGKKHYNSVMTKGDRVVAISRFVAEHMKKTYHVPEEKITIIHRGVDMEYFDPARVEEERVAALREKWRLMEPWPVILMPGRMSRWKGQDFLLKAASRINERQFYCVLVGDMYSHPKYVKDLRNQMITMQLEKHVRLEDTIDDMPAAYKLANVVVSASRKPEAFGRIAVEAQAMGKPVVATDIGGSKETIIHGETGRLVDSQFSSEMAEGLEKGILLGGMDQENLSQTIRAHVAQNFSMQSMCDKTLALYRELLGTNMPSQAEPGLAMAAGEEL